MKKSFIRFKIVKTVSGIHSYFNYIEGVWIDCIVIVCWMELSTEIENGSKPKQNMYDNNEIILWMNKESIGHNLRHKMA